MSIKVFWAAEDDLKFYLALVIMIKHYFPKADSTFAKQISFFVGSILSHTFFMNIL